MGEEPQALKDDGHGHIRHEAGDLAYRLLVTLECCNVTSDELAGELGARIR